MTPFLPDLRCPPAMLGLPIPPASCPLPQVSLMTPPSRTSPTWPIWSSRQHGQPLTHPVAVVVQEMVDSEVSGVLFTVDPVDGDLSRMVINANPGCGEVSPLCPYDPSPPATPLSFQLVVSGAVTPDTITLNRSYFRDTVTWGHVTLGGKPGTSRPPPHSTPSSDADRKQCCLDQSLAIKLGEIGVLVSHLGPYHLSLLISISFQIEQAFDGKPKDIEWAVRDGAIYLLQVCLFGALGPLGTNPDSCFRPVTSPRWIQRPNTSSCTNSTMPFGTMMIAILLPMWGKDPACPTYPTRPKSHQSPYREVMAEPQTPLSLTTQVAAIELCGHVSPLTFMTSTTRL